MAKSYFGIYESQWDAQQALDQGKLLKPFVAIYEGSVHYDDLNEISAGEVEETSFSDISWEGDEFQIGLIVPDGPGTLNWEIQNSTEGVNVFPYNGWVSNTLTVTVSENDGLSSRDLSFDVVFRYGDDTAYTRNVVTVNIQQNAATVEPGYVYDDSWNVVTAITATYHEGSAAYLYPATDGEKPLYWGATSDADWFFFGNTQYAWTNNGESTEIYAYQNDSENPRSTNITFSFYLDEEMQNLVNTVTIPFTQAGHIVQPGYAEPTAYTFTSNVGEQFPVIHGDDLYWRLSTDNSWISFNWGDTGYGTFTMEFTVKENPAADRVGTITVSFYLDEERTILKNTFDITVNQAGDNLFVASWDDENYENVISVSSGSGTTIAYILNNPDGYYMMTNGATADPQTTAFTYSYQESQSYTEQQLSFNIELFSDSACTQWVDTKWLFAFQEGNPDMPHVEFEDENNVPASGGTKVLDIVMAGEAASWSLSTDDTGLSFPDYPGETSITGDSSTTAVTIAVTASTSLEDEQRVVWASFLDQGGNTIVSYQVDIFQDAYRPVVWTFISGSEHVYFPGSYTGDVVAHIAVDAGYYYKFDVNFVEVSSGDTTTDVTATTFSQTNETGYPIAGVCHLTVYTDSGYTDSAYEVWGTYSQLSLPLSGQSYVEYIEHHNVSTDGETQRVCNNNGFGGYNQFAVYDNLYCVELSDGPGESEKVFTFPQSGPHTLTYLRINNDLKMQGWCQNTDAVSAEFVGHNLAYSNDPVGGYGFHGNGYGYTFAGCTALTAVTFDEYMLDIGGDGTNNSTFDGCTSLTTINCYNPNEPAINGEFQTITDNTGTLHIPSGSTYSNWAAALGSNWTVVDDL